MPELDVEEYYDSDVSENEEQHSKLLSSVSQLDSTQRVKPASRKEISSEVSEYNLTKGTTPGKDLINVDELARVLGAKSKHVKISKKLTNVTKKAKTLPKPLEKPVEERLKRSVGFEKVKNQLKRWDAVVTRNALKDHITFPLNNDTMTLQKSNEFLKQFKNASPLEQEISKILKQEPKTEQEEVDKDFPLTLEEMREKRKELAQLRAKLSYRQAKAQRQSKIKSKKFHRILKREKLRQQLKEFEILQKTDPEAALKKLAELDKSRAQERASLRHRNTGQWAKNMTVRAKYDVESRKILADQLKMSREITQKINDVDSSDEEDAKETVTTTLPFSNEDQNPDDENPWSIKVSSEVSEFISGYKKYWEEQNKELPKNQQNEKVNNNKKEISISNGKEDIKENENTNEVVNKNEEEKENDVVKKKEEIKGKQKEGKKNELRNKKDVQKKFTQTPDKNVKNNFKNLNKSEIITNENTSLTKKSPLKKEKTSVSIQPASGVWIVTENSEVENTKQKRKVDEDIDTLFEDLGDRLLKKAKKKAKKIESKLKAEEKKVKKMVEKTNKEKDFDLTLKHQITVERPDLDVGLLEGDEEPDILSSVPVSCQESDSAAPPSHSQQNYSVSAEIDPKKFIEVKPKRLNTHLPDSMTNGEDALDDDEVQQKMIEEAFGDDDVVADFDKMKKEEEKDDSIEISTSLPGWGTWGGTGIKPSRRKKRRVMLNVKPKKHKKKRDTIINENENPKLKDHLVKEVPHPFKSVEAFEANIRAPVGRDWVPETAHRKLIQKQVETKLGTVIEPMDEQEIVRDKKEKKSLYKGKQKNKGKYLK